MIRRSAIFAVLAAAIAAIVAAGPAPSATSTRTVRVTPSFLRTLRISASSPLGQRILPACRRDCRDKASASFRVTR